jgi:cytochrome c oxidase subunit II
MNGLPLIPESASNVSGSIDGIMLSLLLFSAFFTIVIFSTVTFFALKFKRKSDHERPKPLHGSIILELAWSIGPFLILMGIFVWGTKVYFRVYTPQADAMEIFVIAKQWMWKTQHPEGPREINELHLPVNQTVKLTMISEDVIHSFYIPAFRIKRDVLPGRYTTFWFKPTKTGRYHLFCAEYCGTQHSGMIGWITVTERGEYENWLTGGGGGSMADRGKQLFEQYGCASCHREDGKGRGPSLIGVFGKPQKLQAGGPVVANEAYIRESILNPRAKVVAGYQTVMPTFQGQLGEEGLLQIVAYIKSLRKDDLQEEQQ